MFIFLIVFANFLQSKRSAAIFLLQYALVTSYV